MTRTREQIMAEWDEVRAKIAAGCSHSGPRDWLEGVLDEQGYENREGRHLTDEGAKALARAIEKLADAIRAAHPPLAAAVSLPPMQPITPWTSGMLGDRVLSELELSGIASAAQASAAVPGEAAKQRKSPAS